MALFNSIANIVVGFGPITEGAIDLGSTCKEIFNEESQGNETCEHVDDIAIRFFKDSDPYSRLIEVDRHTTFLSKPRICIETPIAISSLAEGISIFSTWINSASRCSAILTCMQAATVFLSFGIIAAIINGLDGIAGIAKAFYYHEHIQKVLETKEINTKPQLDSIFDKELSILALRRNEALKDIVIAIAIVSLFIIANVFSCGLATAVVMAIVSVALCVYKYKAHAKTDQKIAKICEEALICMDLLAEEKLLSQDVIKALIIICRESKCLDRLFQPIPKEPKNTYWINFSWNDALQGLRSITSPFFTGMPATI